MITGLHEWPLVVFTVLGQFSIGGFIVLALVLLSGIPNEKQQVLIHRGLFFIWFLMGIAVLASTLHLGSPMRALNSLLRVGSSKLSNEILGAALFFAIGGLYWLFAILVKIPKGLKNIWLSVTILAGLFFMYSMCRVYEISTVPTWDTIFTPINFIMTLLIGGSILGALLLRPAIEYSPFTARLLPFIAIIAVFISVGNQFLQMDQLTTIHSSVTQATTLVPNYGQLMVWRLALVVLGLACWICPLTRQKAPSIYAISLGFILVTIGELIARNAFYALHMTVGMV